MAFEDPALIRTDRVLTRISVGYRNPVLVGDVLFPEVGVDNQSDKYMVFDKNESRTVHDDLRAPAAHTRELPPMVVSRDSYYAEEHSLKEWVPIEVRAGNADPGVNAMARATRRVTNTILLNRENIVQNMVRTASNYASGHTVTLAGTDQWSDYTNSDPIGDLKAGVTQVQFALAGITPNVALMGWQVAAMLEDHPAFLNRMKTTPLAENRDLSAVGTLTGIGRIVRAGTVYNTAAIGQAATYGYMWGKDVILAYVPDAPGVDEPAFGYEFVWHFSEDPGAGGGVSNPTDRWFDTDRKAWAVRTTRRYDHKFVAVDDVATGKATGGYLIKSAIA